MAFTCLMNAGFPVSPDTLDALNFLAGAMMDQNVPRLSIRADDCEGTISTEGRWYAVGSAAGVKFTATVETDFGMKKIDYIVDPRQPVPDGMPWFEIQNAQFVMVPLF